MTPLDPDGLQQLPVEIILNIVMQLGWEPGNIRSLLGSSRTIRFVLKTHEKHFSQQFASHLYPTSMDPILASSIPSGPIFTRPSTMPLEPKRTLLGRLPPLIRPYTFPWIAELEKRNNILRDLSNSPLLGITIPSLLLSLLETSTRSCASCGLSGINAFKSHGLSMLLSISDARIAGSIDDAQRGQEIWICEQDALALASTIALVWVASMMFDYGDRSTWGSGGCEDNGHGILGNLSAEDSNLEKRQCIYRELVLAHGPYFLWCSVSKSEKETRWVEEMLDKGVEGLKEYEKGTRPVHRSLQSVLLRQLARLKGWEGWYEVFLVVGEDMLLCNAR
ncbi:hypothetical protein VE00_11128 [Pseudogymnoascus sp. WSF 3629]|nr:hypothetical protein VE00_11128 [Pseudogymnoascus sp. WSF 3629]